MEDLYVAMAVMGLISGLLGWAASRLPRALGGQAPMLALAVCVLGMFYFLLYGNGQLPWARLIPSSAAIIYTNLASPLAALAAGFAWRLPAIPRWRRAVLCGLLVVACGISLSWPLLSIALRPPPAGDDRWHADVARQSSWATCSPAAAATLLKHEGIEVSEREMIPLCLTDASGTPTLGLYRGIKLVAQRHRRPLEITPTQLDALIAQDDWPVLLAVELPYGAADPRYEQQWGWIPGMGHSVVALGTTADGRFAIGDPAVGLEWWSYDDLQLLWQGNGLRLP